MKGLSELLSFCEEKVKNKMNLKDIRILHLTNVMDIGGVQKIVYQICEGTKGNLDRIVVASAGGEYADKLQKIGIEHITIEDLSSKSLLKIIHLKKQLSNIIIQNKINLIHCHHRMAVFYIKLWFPKVVIIYNNHTIYSDKRVLSHFTLKNVNLIADGVQAKANLVNFFKLPDKNITIINNAVDEYNGEFYAISEIEKARKEGKFIVMNCSRLHPQKGVNYFIDAAEILLNKGFNIAFFIVGDGPLRNELQLLVGDRGLAENIIFLGFRSDVKSTIRNSDLLVQTSVYEGLPLTPMEAFSVKRAVIGTDIEGTREVIMDGYNGLLAENKNPRSIADKIEILYKDRNKLNEYELNAYKTFTDQFSSKIMIKKYLDFYKKVQK